MSNGVCKAEFRRDAESGPLTVEQLRSGAGEWSGGFEYIHLIGGTWLSAENARGVLEITTGTSDENHGIGFLTDLGDGPINLVERCHEAHEELGTLGTPFMNRLGELLDDLDRFP